MSALPPLGLYLHFPWCVAKCPYCDFNSHTLRGDLPTEHYLTALLADLQTVAVADRARPIATIFLGGGTPSLFPPDAIARLLAAVRSVCTVADDAEITLEANPGALEYGAFAGYRAAGVNRLSLGVQSFSDDSLRALGRIHSSADAVAAYHQARAAGIDNINLDLMYALPGQTQAEAAADVERALELGPEHLSCYHLTLEPNTVFYARPPALPDADLAWAMQDDCAALLGAAGYANYEVSAWSQPGRECRHNLNYWRYGDYLGLGAGAHAKLTRAGGEIVREQRTAHPRGYQQALLAGHAHTARSVAAPDRAFEFMLNALRLRAGVPVADFEARTQLTLAELEPGLSAAQAAGLLEPPSTGCLRATQRGWRFLDDLQAVFLPGDPA